MIQTAEEFVELRANNDPRATHDEAALPVWLEIIEKYPEMREWVVHNKTVPLPILRLLAKDSDPRVRLSIAMKRKCDREIFEVLSRDVDESVRARVAWNRRTPAEILWTLKDDGSPLVREALEGRAAAS